MEQPIVVEALAHLHSLLSEFPAAWRKELLLQIPPEDAAVILEKMEELEAAELAGMLDVSTLIPILDEMRPDEAAAQALKAIRSWAPETDTVYYLFVVDREGALRGVVSLRQLIVTDPSSTVGDIMDPDVIFVRADADQEECARLMSRYDLWPCLWWMRGTTCWASSPWTTW